MYSSKSMERQRPFKSFQMFDYVKQFQSERFWWLMLISGKNISFRNYVCIVNLNHLKVVITIMLPTDWQSCSILEKSTLYFTFSYKVIFSYIIPISIQYQIFFLVHLYPYPFLAHLTQTVMLGIDITWCPSHL
jgi:hypothetical protein